MTPLVVAQNLKVGPITVREIDLRPAVRMARVNCWHMGKFESEAMWRLYARERDGIAIKTVFGRFKDAFVGAQAVHASIVQYRDYQTASIPYGMRITHRDPACTCAVCKLGRAAKAGAPLTLTAEETKALCHEMAQMTLNATNASKTALAAMERVAALETAAAEPPVVH